jgi:hypothetical protein
MELETEFGIEISHARLQKAGTVGALFECVVAELPPEVPRPHPGAYEGPLWDRYLGVVERELGIARTALRQDARFGSDLGVD